MNGIIFGPVPSRRLGQSLGINNIPYKHCTYSCIYCQLGKTIKLTIERKEFYPWRKIVNAVKSKLNRTKNMRIDYITFVPDGEPTLDANIGKEINEIRKLTDIKIAVITNGSLLYREDVQEDLSEANLVSIKVDAVSPKIFKLVNRPHPKPNLEDILAGIKEFSKFYKSIIITETMLVSGINDSTKKLNSIAKFLKQANISKAYIAIPTRPPAEKWVKSPPENKVLEAHQIFSTHLGEDKAQLLISYEGEQFSSVEEDAINGFLSIISVHPMRLDYAVKFFEKNGLDAQETIDRLKRNDIITIIEYRGFKFIMRKHKSTKNKNQSNKNMK